LLWFLRHHRKKRNGGQQSGFVAANQQDGGPSRIEGEKRAKRTPRVLRPKLLQVGNTGTMKRVGVGTPQRWAMTVEQRDTCRQRRLLVVALKYATKTKLVGDFDGPPSP
jgi:hypothetical protein